MIITLLGEFDPPAGFNAIAYVTLNRNTAYVSTNVGQGDRLLVLDRTPASGPALARAPLAVAGDFLYATCDYGNCDNLYVIDISDLANPVVAGRFALPFDVVDMISADQTVYITTTEGILLALDVSEGAMPALVGHLSLAGQELNLAVDGNFLYLAAGDAGLYVVQVER